MKIKDTLTKLHNFVHKYFFWIVLASYLLATFFPDIGLWIRDVDFGGLNWIDKSSIKISLPILMLALLLFNAGLGIKTSELKNSIKNPLILLTGLLANILLPLVLLFFVNILMTRWHNPDELQNILVGLAIVTSMPIAGSSTAWSQVTDGNLALSLGLVVFSTLLSPFTTPIILHSVGFIASGDYEEDLHELAANGTSAFLIFSIVLPIVIGLILKFLAGEKRIEQLKPYIKFVNVIVLMLLIYSNASLVLPKAFGSPDMDFILVIIFITVILCALTFGAGYLIAKLFKAGKAEESSLMFGLGMNNNGGALVLASMALKDHPLILLPIIFYNLAQQAIASYVNMKVFK